MGNFVYSFARVPLVCSRKKKAFKMRFHERGLEVNIGSQKFYFPILKEKRGNLTKPKRAGGCVVSPIFVRLKREIKTTTGGGE